MTGDFWISALSMIAPRMYKRLRVKQADDVRLQQMAAEAMRHFERDANGNLGAVYNGSVFRDLDSGAWYGMIGDIVRDVVQDEFHKMRLMLMAANNGSPEQIAQLVPDTARELPTHVPLRSLVEMPTYRNLVLGMGADGPVKADMSELVHIAVGGSSGWGKSIFLRSIAYQLAMSADPVDLVMIDLEKATLAPFEACDRLLYPVIDSERDTVAVFSELTDELNRRRELFSQYTGVDSLYLYNSMAGEPIKPLVVIGDEITALLADRNVEDGLATLALRARKFGMWLILAGQDWKAANVDTTIRNQLSCCVQFKAKSGAQSRILLDTSDAQNINVQGRALAWLPGRDIMEFQAPIIGRQDIIAAMTGNGPQREMPDTPDDLKQRVIDTWASMERPNITSVTAEIFGGQRGGANWNRVKEIVYSTGLL
jgi:DNA segregation ATPase FtsK/SpoIIIE-like protein